MNSTYSTLNDYLVNFFNDILRIEERTLFTNNSDLSLREMHVIEAVINGPDKNMGNVARRLNITMGTLSTSVKTLESKGYIIRKKEDADKRQVNVYATEKGIEANKRHSEFHHNMVNTIIENLSAKELDIFIKGLDTINAHFCSLESL